MNTKSVQIFVGNSSTSYSIMLYQVQNGLLDWSKIKVCSQTFGGLLLLTSELPSSLGWFDVTNPPRPQAALVEERSGPPSRDFPQSHHGATNTWRSCPPTRCSLATLAADKILVASGSRMLICQRGKFYTLTMIVSQKDVSSVKHNSRQFIPKKSTT